MDAAQSWPQLREWRKRMRARLIAQRMELTATQRREWGRAISASLDAGFPLLAGMAVAFCWPYKGEFDARFAMRRFRERGATTALPVVAAKASPLEFRRWWPGVALKRGAYDIPEPDGTEFVVPDAAFVPMNGFDQQGYRLGYGGGYFDRTLAAAAPRPLAIGVAFEFARLPSIWPQPHDIAMDFVVTEAGLHAVANGRLRRVAAEECLGRARQLCDERGLPRARAEAGCGYSSPPCYAGEFPGYFGEAADEPQR